MDFAVRRNSLRFLSVSAFFLKDLEGSAGMKTSGFEAGRPGFPRFRGCVFREKLFSQSPDLPLPHGLAPSETMV